MMPFEDPPRLVDSKSGAPVELRAALRAAENDGPSETQLAALGVSLGPLLGGGAPPGGLGPAASAAHAAANAGGLGAGKIAALLLAASALAGGGAWLVSHRAAPRSVPTATAAAAKPSPPVAATAAPLAPTAAASPPAAAQPTAPTLAPSPPAAARPTAPDTARTRGSAAAKQNSARPQSTSDSLSEVQLLARAQTALAGDPARALALVNEDEHRFPSGALVQEREVIAIQALSELGQHADAALRARAFEKRFPHSALTRKVEAAAGLH